MALANEQYEYNGLVFGADTDYSLTYIDGLDTWDARDQQVEKALEHGSFTYTEFLRPRVITMQGYILVADAAALAPLLNTLRRTFSAKALDLPMSFKWAGEDEKFVNCKPTRRATPRDDEIVNGYAQFAIQLLAGDPRKYSAVEETLTADGIAANNGSFPTPPVLTITGASTNPRVTNVSTGLYVQVDTSTVAGDSLVIDFATKTITKNGVSVYNTLNSGSRWWQIEPGNNDVTFTGITGTKSLAWRDAWD